MPGDKYGDGITLIKAATKRHFPGFARLVVLKDHEQQSGDPGERRVGL